jgi:hypothetical protein
MSTEVESPQIPKYHTEEMTEFSTVPQYRSEAKKSPSESLPVSPWGFLPKSGRQLVVAP